MRSSSSRQPAFCGRYPPVTRSLMPRGGPWVIRMSVLSGIYCHWRQGLSTVQREGPVHKGWGPGRAQKRMPSMAMPLSSR